MDAEEPADRDVVPGLLEQLAHDARLRLFAGVEAAAGEGPPGLAALVPVRQQHPPVLDHHAVAADPGIHEHAHRADSRVAACHDFSDPSRPVDAIADRYVEDAAALDPAMAAYAGIAGHDDRLPDLSPAGFAERLELDRSALAAARRRRRCDEREQLAQDAFVERLGLEVEMAEAGITLQPGVGDRWAAAERPR